DVETADQIHCFQDLGGIVAAVAFSTDGRRALFASGDTTVRLWDLDTSVELYCFQRHQAAVRCVVFSPDGRTALSGDGYGTVLHWQLPASNANRRVHPDP